MGRVDHQPVRLAALARQRGENLIEDPETAPAHETVRPMEDDEPKALIVRPTSGLQQHDSGAEKVLSRIVSDALTIARGRDIADTSARIRIGKYEFREEDYQQILIWAQEASKTPDDLVSFLEGADNKSKEEESFLVDDGAIKHLTLPDANQFEFPQRKLQIYHLPKLTKLWCDYSAQNLAKLEFVCKSSLEELHCDDNQLTELDLSKVPALTELYCFGNQLTELDLSKVPALTDLDCKYNHQISELDVRGNPNLKVLKCDQSVRIIKHEWQSFSDAK